MWQVSWVFSPWSDGRGGGRWGRGEDNTKHSEPHGEDGTFLANPSCLPLPPGSHTWCCSVPGFWSCSFISVQSVVSDSLWPHGLQHARLPCPSPTPGAYSNSCPSRQWCHPIIPSSVVPFSACPQSFPASGPFPMSQFFASGGQSIGVSASAPVLPLNIQDWFPLGWTGWISLQSTETPKSLLQHHSSKVSILQCSAFFIHPYMTTGKTIALTRRTFVGKVKSLLFNKLSRLVITFLPRSKHLLISPGKPIFDV